MINKICEEKGLGLLRVPGRGDSLLFIYSWWCDGGRQRQEAAMSFWSAARGNVHGSEDESRSI